MAKCVCRLCMYTSNQSTPTSYSMSPTRTAIPTYHSASPTRTATQTSAARSQSPNQEHRQEILLISLNRIITSVGSLLLLLIVVVWSCAQIFVQICARCANVVANVAPAIGAVMSSGTCVCPSVCMASAHVPLTSTRH